MLWLTVIKPGDPHWRSSDPPLKNHTRATETEATYTLTVWPNPPNDEDATDQGQIFECIQKEWTARVGNIEEAAAAEVAEANKDDDGEVNKGDSKWDKPKPKRATHSSKKKDKDSSLKKIEPPDDNLDEYFGSSQGQNNQGTTDVTPTETPKKSEEAKLKNDPKSSSCRRVHRSPQGSAHEGSPGPSSKSKQSA